MTKRTLFVGVPCKLLPPKKGYRPAIWECMLGTVYAMNDAGEVRYFDYDHAAARSFSGVLDPKREKRLAKKRLSTRYSDKSSDLEPRKGRIVLWIEPSKAQLSIARSLKIMQKLRLVTVGYLKLSKSRSESLYAEATEIRKLPADQKHKEFDSAYRKYLISRDE